MFKQERQVLLLKILHATGKLICADVCKELNISRDTFYRDVNELASRGSVVKVHGAVLPVANRRDQDVISTKAAPFVHPGMFITAIGGDEILNLAKTLSSLSDISFLTTNVAAVLEFKQNTRAYVALMGNKVVPQTGQVQGIEAIDQIRKFDADICFVEIPSINSDGQVLAADAAHIIQTAVKNAKLVVGLYPWPSSDRAYPVRVCEIQEVDVLVSSLSSDDHRLDRFRNLTRLS